MSWSVPFAAGEINLSTDRVPRGDGARQERTAVEILRRLEDQPGLILADEVGMGKTFVALAVVASVVLARQQANPVVVMVPAALRDKWPRDAEVFREKCLLTEMAKQRFTTATASDAVEFFKLMDDPPDHRKAVVFVTHGALARGLNDPWVKLALIRSTLQRRKKLKSVRKAFPRMASRLLWIQKYGLRPDQYETLLNEHPHRWFGLLQKFGVPVDDHPVPEALLERIGKVDKEPIAEALLTLPRNVTPTVEGRIKVTRELLSTAIQKIWRSWLGMTVTRSPLLVLDEAHHFKNPMTRHASLFQDADAAEAATLVTGPLADVFERMLFLTATPFQLGHRELVEVLSHFQAIRWGSRLAPEGGKAGFLESIEELNGSLDDAQLAALRFEQAWGRLRPLDIAIEGQLSDDIDDWWQRVIRGEFHSRLASEALRRFERAAHSASTAERALKPWVIRHCRSRHLPDHATPRRVRLEGRAIEADEPLVGNCGLEVEGPALLPFLLAARASVALEARIRQHPNEKARAVFSEGLASSYESYLYSRQNRDGRDSDAAVNGGTSSSADGDLEWYLRNLDAVLPRDTPESRMAHPKVLRTVKRAIELWAAGEKVVIFCHYIATGKALREHLSRSMRQWVRQEAARQLGLANEDEAEARLDNLGDRFMQDAGLRPTVRREMAKIVESVRGLIGDDREALIDVASRFIRTPTFLVRYFPLGDRNRPQAFKASLDRPDKSGQTLREQILALCSFLANRCTGSERAEYLQALKSIQTGRIRGEEVLRTVSADEEVSRSELFMPNVRFVFGNTKPETRRTLMLAFNTPLFPEILISSSVLAEGVDLHLCCRHVIHHDLDWNPSTLEQRTGRIDRLGAKAEQTKKSIRVYLPYVAGTHDEKQFRVVCDRERWFQVVMGEKIALDELSTENIAQRVPLPAEAARRLSMKLGLESDAGDS